MRLIWLALRTDPAKAIYALWCLARRYRVRGRRVLREAAASHPDYLRYWLRSISPEFTSRWCEEQGRRSDLSARQAVLVLGDPGRPADATVRSFSMGLPGAPIVMQQECLGDALTAVEAAGAEWLIVVRAGDICDPSLGAVFDTIPADIATDVIYWDHADIGPQGPVEPAIKPDWDPVLARSCDLLGTASAIRIAAVRQTRAFGSAGQDLARALGRAQLDLAAGSAPLHVPLVLTHSRCSQPLLEAEERRAALSGKDEAVGFPGVSIIIPTRDQAAVLSACINGLDQLTYPGPVETIIIDNDSVEPATHDLFRRLAKRKNTRVLAWPGAFNFAAMMNFAAEQAGEPFLCLLNNDVEPLDGGWLQCMMHEALAPEVGAVGARLLYPDGTIQHVGVAIGLGNAAGHVQKGVDPKERRFRTWHQSARRVSAVTAACLVVDKAKYQAVGGMDAETFGVDYNDVDFCLKLDRAGWHNLIVPEATLIHHESKSRGRERKKQDKPRFKVELNNLQQRWATEGYNDPWHSPLFLKEAERCILRS